MAKGDAFRVGIIAGVAILIVGMVAALTPIALQVYRLNQYHSYTRRIYAAIDSMPPRRPPHVNAKVWDEACSWLHTAAANICFSPSHVPEDEVRQLCAKFEARVKDPVDLNTVEWMWDEFAAASPHGAQYSKQYRTVYLECIKQRQPELLTAKTRNEMRAAPEKSD